MRPPVYPKEKLRECMVWCAMNADDVYSLSLQAFYKATDSATLAMCCRNLTILTPHVQSSHQSLTLKFELTKDTDGILQLLAASPLVYGYLLHCLLLHVHNKNPDSRE